MNAKRILTSLVCGSLCLLTACDSGSSSSVQPVDPIPGNELTASSDSSTPIPVPESSVSGSGVAVTNPPSGAANLAMPTSLYGIWKPYHYVTLEEEAVAYPSMGSGFAANFAAFGNAGRVIWSTSTDENCWIPEAQGTPKYKRGCTVSEGIGYGMLISLFQGDWDTFNRIWTYNRAFRQSPYINGTELMPWLVGTFDITNVPSAVAATDADLDVATSLILAYYMTSNAAYLNDAKLIVNAIWKHLVNTEAKILYSGDTPVWKKATSAYNLSYFSPVALRLFALVDTDPTHNWKDILDGEYAYMTAIQQAGVGVFPDWTSVTGAPIDPKNGSATKTYWTFNKESVRIPWRIAWDQYWFQDPRATQILTTLNTFISGKSGGNVNNIPATNFSYASAYGADVTNTKLSVQWLGAWCLTGMGNNPTWLSNCTTLFNTMPMETSLTSYFPNILQMMFSQLMNGLYVKPSNMGI
ncbi:MAG: hypothetical protein HUK21_01650 [Fibrobacteraceae bacterium]|nr:hypothetical protein [Fibrobacteraceae bacterium]